MVKEIKIVNRAMFEKWRPDKIYPDGFFISIACPGDAPLLEESGNTIGLLFDDIERPVMDFVPFNEEMAAKLYEFIDRNIHRDICVVHCDAGISRSGAVGAFIADRAGIPWETFRRNNPGILPNNLVRRLLIEQHAKTLAGQEVGE